MSEYDRERAIAGEEVTNGFEMRFKYLITVRDVDFFINEDGFMHNFSADGRAEFSPSNDRCALRMIDEQPLIGANT